MSLQDKIKSIPLMKPEDIEIRIGQVDQYKASYITLLLYKNARVDMQILDDVFGTFGWARSHREIKGNLYCTVNLWDEENKQWVPKEDVGTESNTEAEKGEASDSFKRACVNVGIGRELYSAPKIYINPPAVKIEEDTKGKKICKDRFVVTDIAYTDDRKIRKLVIAKESYNKRTTVFEWESLADYKPQHIPTKEPPIPVVNTPTPEEEKEKNDLLYGMDFQIIKLSQMREKDPEFIVDQLRKKVKFDGEIRELPLDGVKKVYQVVSNWIKLAEDKKDEVASED